MTARMLRAFSTAARRPVRAGEVSPERAVPASIVQPPYAANYGMSQLKPFIPILDKAQQQKLRDACALARDILQFTEPLVQPGQTTDEIDRLVHEEILRHKAYPSPLRYGGFPKSLCSSVNEIVVHGIPDSRELQDGDIVNIDISVFLNGFHGDTSQTFLVGDVDDAGRELVQVTNDALLGAIDQCCKPHTRFSTIGAFVHNLVEERGFDVIREYTGHGIGQEFHCLPYIIHNRNSERGTMLPGMAFTVEPAVCEGSPEVRGASCLSTGVALILSLPADHALGRRLDCGDGGRQPMCAGRAHSAHHGQRRRDSHVTICQPQKREPLATHNGQRVKRSMQLTSYKVLGVGLGKNGTWSFVSNGARSGSSNSDFPSLEVAERLRFQSFEAILSHARL